MMMSKTPKRPTDMNQVARFIVDAASGENSPAPPKTEVGLQQDGEKAKPTSKQPNSRSYRKARAKT